MKDMFTEVVKSIKKVLIETFLEIKLMIAALRKL